MSIYIAIDDQLLSYTSQHTVKGDIDKWRRVNIYFGVFFSLQKRG